MKSKLTKKQLLDLVEKLQLMLKNQTKLAELRTNQLSELLKKYMDRGKLLKIEEEKNEK